MTRRTIPGVLDAAGLALLAGMTDDEYRRRAQVNKPPLDGLKAEVLRLFHSGLTARDISQALRVAEPDVQEWIARASS